MQENPLSYIPMDRRHAMVHAVTLPDPTYGAALFADVSGFTPLTEALVREMGPQRGAEELTHYLNQVYDALVDEIHRWHGSAIAFAGDAVTCWFDGDDGTLTTACALAMQTAMQRFASIRTPFGSEVSLSMKASVAVGPARRFLVGDPHSRVIDAVAGATLERLAAGEHLATRGEVVVDETILATLDDRINVREVRKDDKARRFGVVQGLCKPVYDDPWPELAPDALTEEQVRPWVLPAIYERLQRGLGEFLAELRPTVAVFLRFSGIDFDADPAAGEKLDAYIRWVQSVVDRYAGTLIDLNIGDKGSYIYINFGAPIAHEDNAARAAATAYALRMPPPELDFIEPVQIGIAQGRMRAGAYGGAMHRTYGVLGDSVNLAARLMMKAQPGQILINRQTQAGIENDFIWENLPPVQVKGKRDPIEIAALLRPAPRLAMHLPTQSESTPLIGREEEMARLTEKLALAKQGQGQLLSLVGDAGVGKSRLVAAFLHVTEEQEWLSYGGECESTGINTAYLVWQSIWRGLLGIDPEWEMDHQIDAVTQRVREVQPALARRIPLLGPVLNLPIPDNSLTRSFDAKLRKTSLEALLVDLLLALTQDTPTVIVLEDCHWMDALSHDLLEAIGRAIVDRPVYILLSLRMPDLARLQEQRITALPHHTLLVLTGLAQDNLEDLARLRLIALPTVRHDRPIPGAFVQRLTQQAEGNPFYLEELINYVGDRGIDPSDPLAVSQLELPSSVQSLVLSRMDQLADHPRTMLKVASVIGRIFRTDWLAGVYPDLGEIEELHRELATLSEQGLTVFDAAALDPTYAFKHIITHNVVYESLLHVLRVTLHGQIGRYIEDQYADARERYLSLLAYHYGESENVDKKRLYLRRAGEVAQATFANDAAIEYYRRVLPLLEGQEKVEVLLKLGGVEQLVGQWEQADVLYHQALALAESIDDRAAQAWCLTAIGELLRMQGAYPEAWERFELARSDFEQAGDLRGVAQALHYIGNVAVQQGDYVTASARYHDALELRRQLDDRSGIARLLNNLAIIAEYQTDFTTALQLHQEALEIRRGLGERAMVAYSLNNLGVVVLAQGDQAAARECLGEAVELQREIGDRWGLANALGNLGNVVRAQEDYGEAKRLYDESLNIHSALGDKWAIAELLTDMGGLAVLQGDAGRGVRLLAAAEKLRTEIGAALPPNDQEKVDRIFAPAQEALGARAEEVKHEGYNMMLADAIAYALG